MCSSQSMSNVPSIRPRAIGDLTFNAIGALFVDSCPQLVHDLFVESFVQMRAYMWTRDDRHDPSSLSAT